MSPIAKAVLLSWSIPAAATFALLLTAIIYLRGWWLLRRARVPFVPAWRAASFLLGLLAVSVALASPLDTFSAFLITAHMLQHMLLMMVAPPLLLLGAPLIPLVRGLPLFATREFVGPFLNWHVAQRVGRTLISFWMALVLMGGVMFAWHTPRLYELALGSSAWHEFEHACFFVVSLVFWWPVVQPWPSQPHAPRWMVVPYLLIADVENTVLSAILVFSDRVIYPSYSAMPRLFGFPAQHDQAASGAIMWVLGSVAFLIPAVVIVVQWLSGTRRARALDVPPGRAASPQETWLGSLVQRSRSDRKLQAVTFTVLFVAAGMVWAALAANGGDDDDQALRAHMVSGSLALSFFGAPDFQRGSNDVAVLLQDGKTGDVLLDAEVAASIEGGGESASEPGVGLAPCGENKLLYCGDIDVPAGNSLLRVKVTGTISSAEFSLPIKASQSEAQRRMPVAYVVLVVFAALLSFVYWRRHRAVGVGSSRDPQAADARPETY
jgi:cytochrome c oxidase assembly factor CtaG